RRLGSVMRRLSLAFRVGDNRHGPIRIADGPRQATTFGASLHAGWPARGCRGPKTAKDGQIAAFSTVSPAFSPIIIDGALVLPDVSVGMIEASAIRRPAIPWTRSWASTTAIGSDPIVQVPTGW